MRLIQEKYRNDPWKIFVVCIILNQTRGDQAAEAIEQFFRRWPRPESINGRRSFSTMQRILRPTGLATMKTERILSMTYEFLAGIPANELTGIGKYGIDSYRIFFLDDRSTKPDDEKLIRYMKENYE